MRRKTRRGRGKFVTKVMALSLAGFVAFAIFLGPTASKAQDSAALLPILKQIYDQAMEYQKSFNAYVGKFNTFMDTAENTKNFVDDMRNIDKVFLQTKTDVENILNGFVGKTGGDWTKLRLQKVHLQSIAIAKYFKRMSSYLDDIEKQVSTDASTNGLKDKPAKVATVQLKKDAELKMMKAEAVLAASSQRREAFRSLLTVAKNDKAKAEAELAAASVTQEELQKRILEQLVLANRLAMVQIEIQTHGRPLTVPEQNISSKDFEAAWGRIEKNADYD